MKLYRGGCSCRAVLFTVRRYLYVQACHCDACKKRTGSAYGLSVMVESDDVAAFSGQTRTYTRSGESGKEVHYEFCPQCGATIRWRIDIVPNRQVFAGGAFDDIREFNVVGEMYTGMALPWARLGCDLTRSGAPDDNFRASLIERTNSLRD
jgi:hypothetical protein